MKYVAVLPWVYKPFRDACMEHCKLDVLEIDNSEDNLGIMRSHNIGIKKMREENADWLIVLSAAIRFGEAGGLDFVEELNNHPECISISATDKDTWEKHKQVGIYGWHCIAFSRECIEQTGKWDENFFPYGYDDIDYMIRMQKAFINYSSITCKVAVDISDTVMAHSVNLGGIRSDNQKQQNYLLNKWGQVLWGEEKVNDVTKLYERPFNDPKNSLSYWPETREGGRWQW